MFSFFAGEVKPQSDYTLYVMIAEECPICNFMGRAMSDIGRDYGDKVNLKLVFPLKMSNYKSIHEFKKKYNLMDYESILDKNQELTRQLKASVTPEAILTNSDGEVFYRGRINDAYSAPGKIRHGAKKQDLRMALDKLLNGSMIDSPWPDAIGCYITFRDETR
jgi:hypothetical protein